MTKATRSIHIAILLFSFFRILSYMWPKYHTKSHSNITSSLLKRYIPDNSSNEFQCEDVISQNDQCAFVKEYCSDYSTGLIDYIDFYFCSMKSIPTLALILLGVWMAFLFAFIGITASDYFCPNLNTISKKLHLSESTTGVTFLAFGNASPDIFSTFSAIGAGSGTLAIGEVVGAAAFTTSVVVGSMMIAKPFEVYRKPFLRDTIVFTGCILYTLYIVICQKITFWHSITLIGAYVLYVAYVVYGSYHHEEQSESCDLDTQYEQVLDEYVDNDDDIEHKRTSKENVSQVDSDHRRFTITVQDDISNLDVNNCDCLSETAPCLVNPPLPLAHNHGSKSPQPETSRGLCTPINTYTSIPSALSPTPKSPLSASKSPKSPLSTSRHMLGIDLGGCSFEPPVENDLYYGRFQQAVLHHSLILPDRSDPNTHPRSPIFQDPHRKNYFQEDVPSATTEWVSSLLLNWAVPAFFPTLLEWKEKTWWARLLSIGSIPIVFILNLTLPVVDLVKADDDNEEGCSQLTSPSLSSSSSSSSSQEVATVSDGDASDDDNLIFDNWCKSYTMIQMVFAPLLVATATDIAGSLDNTLVIVLSALGVGVLMSTLIYFTSTEAKPPRYYELLAFAGFIVSMTWIFLVANEVVGVLRALGLIFGISDAILGLTIFAVGNSLGDMISNVTFARMGYPRMAFSACFGGPLLNMLLGVGVSGLYVTLKEGKPVPLEMSPTLLVSIGGVLVTMIAMMVVVPLNGYVASRGWGIFLVGMYCVFMVVNVVLEVKKQ